MKTNRLLLLFIALFFAFFANAQGYDTLSVKEDYDRHNDLLIKKYRPCELAPNDPNLDKIYGDGMSYVLDGYLTMYKTTKDKGYLYKYVIQSLCMMENRSDMSAINDEPRWARKSAYHDGLITGAMAYFIYFINIENPDLRETPLFPFQEIKYNCSGLTFYTFGEYADWLNIKLSETLTWYFVNNYWNDIYGFKMEVSKNFAAPINMQVGYARALLFLGLVNININYLEKANFLAKSYLKMVSFKDPCKGESFKQPLMRLDTAKNAYWWYHDGWRLTQRDCWGGKPPVYYRNAFNFTQYTTHVEDMSHAGLTLLLPIDFYLYSPTNPFSTTDMVRFRNTFTKFIFDGENGFYNTVRGSDSTSTSVVKPHNFYRMQAATFMQYEIFDNADTTATKPNVYDILMNFYATDIADKPELPSKYTGKSNQGHADIVKAHWKHDNLHLLLFSRKIVYDIDYRAKKTIRIEPKLTNSDTSYFEPKITTKEFNAEKDAYLNISAGESVIIKPGTHFKAGSCVNVAIY